MSELITIEKLNSVTRGFHTDMIAVILNKPTVKLLDITIDGSERFLLVGRNT